MCKHTHPFFRLLALLTAGCLCCALLGCTARSSHDSVPEDAAFCQDISQQVQRVEQLHIASSTTQLTSNAPAAGTTLQYTPTYAMWFPAMDYAGLLEGASKEAFRQAMASQFSNAAAMGINTVFLQVRAYQDAYYNSHLFPPGKAVSFDPLAVMLEEAHRLGLSAHAWINPMRGPTDTEMRAMASQYRLRCWYDDPEKNGTYLVQWEGRWWLNPAYADVRQYIADGAAEIAANYDVDGIHIDDYFYPTTDKAFDAAAFAQSGGASLSDFRFQQTSAMVQLLYQTVHEINDALRFSISPQGTLHGNYDSQFADVKRWGKEAGYCDMLIPQIYFGFLNETAPFSDTVTLWKSIVTCPDVSLVIGIGTHKFGKEDVWAGTGSQEWIDQLDIPQRQVAYLTEQIGLDGIAFYSYRTTFAPDIQADAMAQQVEAITALLRS